MKTSYIKADSFLMENRTIANKYLQIKDGKFGSFVDQPPANSEVADWSGYTIAPGLFDTHIHGIKGNDVMDGSKQAIKNISKELLKIGVTRFLPTTLTASTEDLNQAVAAVAKAVDEGLPGAQSEGIYLEGPYFTETHKGAQNPAYFKDPNYEEFRQWQQRSNNQIVKIALAPERKGAKEFIRKLALEGIKVSLGHTDASYDCCREAVDAGADTFVHLFNGMKGLHHREPGVVGAACTLHHTFAEMICDGHHVHPAIASMVAQMKKEQLVLITDCMRAGLMPDGVYQLGEFPVYMENGIARTETGSLAGSTLQLVHGVKNLRAWTQLPLHEVWHRASLSPAKSLNKDDKLGSIAPGKLADYVVLNNQLEVHAAAIEGEVKYQQEYK